MNVTDEQHIGLQPLVMAQAVIPGLMEIDCGMVIFNPISIGDYMQRLNRNDFGNMAYHTRSMGRGVFTFGKAGEIVNYKGVDSRIQIGEIKKHNISNLLWGTNERHEIDMVFFKHGSYKGHSKKPQIRVKGASQLQDLIYECEKIARYQKNPLIKLPHMMDVKAFPLDFCLKYHLPIPVKATQAFLHQMESLDREDREKGIIGKSRLHAYGEMQKIGLPCESRTQTWGEYFSSLPRQEWSMLQNIPDFNIAVEEEDHRYSLGATFGQAKRILESPFRISDLVYYLETRNIAAVKAILDYSRTRYSTDYLIYYARTMGKNAAGFMNEGLANHLWSHRQDFALSAEICDEAFNDVRKNLSEDDCMDRYEQLKSIKENATGADVPKDILNEYDHCDCIMTDKTKYYAQIYLFASNMMAIENAYRLVGYELDTNHVNSFAESFIGGLERKKETLEAIFFWYHQLFGENGKLGQYLGVRAQNTIRGYEEYIERFHDSLCMAAG